MKRHLVIVRAGDTSLHPDWLSADRDWDIIVNYFGDDPNIYRGDQIERIDSKGPKWPALHELMMQLHDRIAAYDYVWFPDDDLACSPESLAKLFAMCREHHLDLAQPALTHNSHIGVSITVANRAFRLRYTNFIEIMAPCFSRRFLQRCWPSFNTSLSGWGLDFVWPRWAESPEKVAIIDVVQIHHTRPHGGPNYNLLKDRGIDPDKELHELLNREGLKLEYVIKGGVDLEGNLLATWNGKHTDLIRKIMNGYLPEFANFPDILFSIIQPVLREIRN